MPNKLNMREAMAESLVRVFHGQLDLTVEEVTKYLSGFHEKIREELSVLAQSAVGNPERAQALSDKIAGMPGYVEACCTFLISDFEKSIAPAPSRNSGKVSKAVPPAGKKDVKGKNHLGNFTEDEIRGALAYLSASQPMVNALDIARHLGRPNRLAGPIGMRLHRMYNGGELPGYHYVGKGLGKDGADPSGVPIHPASDTGHPQSAPQITLGAPAYRWPIPSARLKRLEKSGVFKALYETGKVQLPRDFRYNDDVGSQAISSLVDDLNRFMKASKYQGPESVTSVYEKNQIVLPPALYAEFRSIYDMRIRQCQTIGKKK